MSARSWSQVAGANTDIRLAIAGLNGRGKELAAQFPQIPGVRVVAFCDCDTAILDHFPKTVSVNLTGRAKPLDVRPAVTFHTSGK